ncbi:unnamed protein product [Meloidogyne enterolobii]|uniref:Uncharacterized protein n=1 Tax=Meloidogyne enterolobii TaxID=390850 RepID=A0ACB0ZFG7_MELEN
MPPKILGHSNILRKCQILPSQSHLMLILPNACLILDLPNRLSLLPLRTIQMPTNRPFVPN